MKNLKGFLVWANIWLIILIISLFFYSFSSTHWINVKHKNIQASYGIFKQKMHIYNDNVSSRYNIFCTFESIKNISWLITAILWNTSQLFLLSGIFHTVQLYYVFNPKSALNLFFSSAVFFLMQSVTLFMFFFGLETFFNPKDEMNNFNVSNNCGQITDMEFCENKKPPKYKLCSNSELGSALYIYSVCVGMTFVWLVVTFFIWWRNRKGHLKSYEEDQNILFLKQ